MLCVWWSCIQAAGQLIQGTLQVVKYGYLVGEEGGESAAHAAKQRIACGAAAIQLPAGGWGSQEVVENEPYLCPGQ